MSSLFVNKSWDLLHNRLLKLAQTRGFQSNLARRLGVRRSAIQTYLKKERTPGLDFLDRIAEALGTHSWELIRPDGAESPHKTAEALFHVIKTQETRINELEKALGSNPIIKATYPLPYPTEIAKIAQELMDLCTKGQKKPD